LALYVYPTGNVWDTAVADRFTHAIEKIDPEATGFIVTTHHHMQIIISGFERAAAIAAVLVFIMLLIDFRRLTDALLALIPLGMGWLWMLGIMSATGIAFNVANIVSLPLVLGIGIDAGVHIVHRCNESAADNNGVGRLDDLLRGTGGAVFLSSLTTIAGFAGLMISDYGAMFSLGLAMVIGVATCLVASLAILPAILVVLKRAA
jgi:predicted RND superfamily exporter protein